MKYKSQRQTQKNEPRTVQGAIPNPYGALLKTEYRVGAFAFSFRQRIFSVFRYAFCSSVILKLSAAF